MVPKLQKLSYEQNWNIWDCGLLKREETELQVLKLEAGSFKDAQRFISHSIQRLLCSAVQTATQDIYSQPS